MIIEKVMLNASTRGVKEIIHAVQGENDSRTLEFQVYDTSGKIVNLTNATVYFYVQKNDGTIVMLPASISDNTASVVLTLQTCSVEGDHSCWIQIVIPNESDLRVDDIILRVQACDFDGAVESSSEFTALTEATSAAITATENANNAAAEARSTAASTATATINAQKAQPNGLASLDAAGKLEQMPTYEDIGAVPTTRTVNEKALSSNISLTYSDVGAISTTEKGAANGIATLDVNGKLIQPPTYDYVTEQGTSDGWSYKKWSSGKVECWGIKTVNGAINDNQSVSPHTKLALPFNIYNRSLQLMSITSSIGWKVRFAYINPSTSTDGQVATIVYTVDGTNTETNLAASIYIVGEWE